MNVSRRIPPAKLFNHPATRQPADASEPFRWFYTAPTAAHLLLPGRGRARQVLKGLTAELSSPALSSQMLIPKTRCDGRRNAETIRYAVKVSNVAGVAFVFFSGTSIQGSMGSDSSQSECRFVGLRTESR